MSTSKTGPQVPIYKVWVGHWGIGPFFLTFYPRGFLSSTNFNLWHTLNLRGFIRNLAPSPGLLYETERHLGPSLGPTIHWVVRQRQFQAPHFCNGQHWCNFPPFFLGSGSFPLKGRNSPLVNLPLFINQGWVSTFHLGQARSFRLATRQAAYWGERHPNTGGFLTRIWLYLKSCPFSIGVWGTGWPFPFRQFIEQFRLVSHLGRPSKAGGFNRPAAFFRRFSSLSSRGFPPGQFLCLPTFL